MNRATRGCLLATLVLITPGFLETAAAHDIPDARVDRSIQVTLRPGRIAVSYEVSLAELTLVRDLRRLVEAIPAGLDRDGLFRLYGTETMPLNARGFIISVDGEPIELASRDFTVEVEEHPRYVFRFEANLPERGRLFFRDSNFSSGEGTSRLALETDRVQVSGYDGPRLVSEVPIRPLWMLSPEEHRRTVELRVTFAPGGPPRPEAAVGDLASKGPAPAPSPEPRPASPRPTAPSSALTRLLDQGSGWSRLALIGLAFVLGLAHAVQPGHGKTLVAAASVGEHAGRGVALAVVTTLAHISGVLALAVVLWVTRTVRYSEINASVMLAAGFVIAAIGFWRLGRGLGGHDVVGHTHGEDGTVPPAGRGLIWLGLAGGLVPCWDAVILVVVAEALGRLGFGIALLTAFSAGMGLVLVLVGLAAARLRDRFRPQDDPRWARRLGMFGGAVLAGIGLLMMR